MREFLKGLDLDKETIDTIMAEHGKLITEAKEKTQDLENKVKDYESKIEELSSKAETNTKIQEELDNLKKSIAENEAKAKAKAEDDALTKNITSAFGDKKFVNEYTKNAIISDIKTALKDSNNAGKSVKDLFEELTKDKEGIFDNPNKGVSTPPTGDVNTGLAKENHDRELLGLDLKK
ncbi:MAG: phage scaffolding protein [Mycoplasma sp.]|nr:phage scaffolding protein [Mycoplasma sp.]